MGGQENLVEVRPGLFKRALGGLVVFTGAALGGLGGYTAGDAIAPEDASSLLGNVLEHGTEGVSAAGAAVVAGLGTLLLKNVFWFETEHIWSDLR